VLLHLIDAYTDDIAGAYQTIRQELSNYKIDLKDRPEIIALTKIEGLDDDIIQMQVDAVKAVAGKTPVFAISAIAHKGLTELLRALRKKVEQSRKAVDLTDETSEEIETISLGKAKIVDAWDVERIEDAENDGIFFKVTGEKVEKFARRTDFSNFEGVNRLRDIMKKLGIAHELRRQGAEGDSIIQIAGNNFTFLEQ
jgi:GTP-binding protein